MYVSNIISLIVLLSLRVFDFDGFQSAQESSFVGLVYNLEILKIAVVFFCVQNKKWCFFQGVASFIQVYLR